MSEPARWTLWLKPENILVGILLGLLAWMPFPHGADRTWAEIILAVGFAGVLLAWSGLVMGGFAQQTPYLRALRWPAACMGAAIGWSILQCLDLAALDAAFGLGLTAWAHPVWHGVQEVLGPHASAHVSIDPDRTRAALLETSLPVMAFLLAFNLCRDRQRAGIMLGGVVAIALAFTALSAAELVFRFDAHAAFLSETDRGHRGLIGPFAHPDHFAAFLTFAALAAFGLFAERFRLAVAWDKRWPERLGSAARSLGGSDGVWLFAGLCLLATIVATQSGAAVAALLAGLSFLALALSLGPLASEAEARGQRVMTASLVVILALAVVAGEQALVERFGPGELQPEQRQSIAASAVGAIRATPLQGQGFGTFGAYYPSHAQGPVSGRVDAAGNSALEALADLGVPAGLAWLAAPVMLAGLCLSGVGARRRDRAFAAIAVGTSICAGVLAMTGFSLQLPAVSVMLALLLGIGTTQSSRTNMDLVR